MKEHCSGPSFSLTRLALAVLLVGATLPAAARAESTLRIGMLKRCARSENPSRPPAATGIRWLV